MQSDLRAAGERFFIVKDFTWVKSPEHLTFPTKELVIFASNVLLLNDLFFFLLKLAS